MTKKNKIKTNRKLIEKSLQKQLSASISSKRIISFLFCKIKRTLKRITKNKNYPLSHNIFFWINGQYAMALLKTNNEKSLYILKNFYNKCLVLSKLNFKLFEIPDTLIHAYIILKLKEEHNCDKYDVLIDEFIDYINKREIIYYRDNNLFYIDELGMVVDCLYELYKYSDNEDYLYKARKHLDFAIKNCYPKEQEFPFHVYDDLNKNHSKDGRWGRGSAWFLLGLTSAIVNGDKDLYLDTFLRLINNITNYQDKEGYLPTVFVVNSHIDTSTTSMVMYCISEIVKCDYINDKEELMFLKKKLDKGLNALLKSTTKDGMVMDSSGECLDVNNYSYSYGNYFSQSYTLMALINYENYNS